MAQYTDIAFLRMLTAKPCSSPKLLFLSNPIQNPSGNLLNSSFKLYLTSHIPTVVQNTIVFHLDYYRCFLAGFPSHTLGPSCKNNRDFKTKVTVFQLSSQNYPMWRYSTGHRRTSLKRLVRLLVWTSLASSTLRHRTHLRSCLRFLLYSSICLKHFSLKTVHFLLSAGFSYYPNINKAFFCLPPWCNRSSTPLWP